MMKTLVYGNYIVGNVYTLLNYAIKRFGELPSICKNTLLIAKIKDMINNPPKKINNRYYWEDVLENSNTAHLLYIVIVADIDGVLILLDGLHGGKYYTNRTFECMQDGTIIES